MSIYFMIIGAVGGILIVSGGSVCVYFDDINTSRPSIFFLNKRLIGINDNFFSNKLGKNEKKNYGS